VARRQGGRGRGHGPYEVGDSDLLEKQKEGPGPLNQAGAIESIYSRAVGTGKHRGDLYVSKANCKRGTNDRRYCDKQMAAENQDGGEMAAVYPSGKGNPCQADNRNRSSKEV